MKISVVIPVYNREKLVKRSINSVLNNLNFNSEFEIILVDDGSSDNSKKIIFEFVNKFNNIFAFSLSKNSGVNFARDYGVSKSNGDYILFLDSDDTIENFTFNEFEKTLNKFKNEKIFYFSTKLEKSNKLLSKTKYDLKKYSYFDYLSNKFSGEFLPFIHKSVFDKIKIDKSRLAFESIFWTNVIKNYGVVVSSKILRIYFLDSNNRISKELFNINHINKRINDYKFYLDSFGKDILKFNLLNKYSKILDILGIFSMSIKDKKSARNYLKLSYNYDKNFRTLLLLFLTYFGHIPFRLILIILKFKA